jgi:hypothetical protein
MAAHPVLKQVLGISGHPISAATMEPSPASAESTESPSRYLPEKPITSNWVLPTSFSLTNACCLPLSLQSDARGYDQLSRIGGGDFKRRGGFLQLYAPFRASHPIHARHSRHPSPRSIENGQSLFSRSTAICAALRLCRPGALPSPPASAYKRMPVPALRPTA